MARSSAFNSTLLVVATLLALFPSTATVARVGVTSVTEGDPLGKPPSEVERILRVGIDVQANELITTQADDRAHLVFLDGTSLTVGPNARVTIDRFVFDPATKTGDLALTASTGVFRLVGGKISKDHPIVVTTPTSTIGIRGGITIFEVQPARTTSTFVFGHDMTVTAQGQVQLVTRPGWQVTTYAGTAPGQAAQTPPGSLAAELKLLEAIGGQPSDADNAAKTSGFADQNSGLGPAGGGLGANDTTINGAATNAVNNANTSLQRPTITPTPVPMPPAGPPRSPGN